MFLSLLIKARLVFLVLGFLCPRVPFMLNVVYLLSTSSLEEVFTYSLIEVHSVSLSSPDVVCLLFLSSLTEAPFCISVFAARGPFCVFVLAARGPFYVSVHAD